MDTHTTKEEGEEWNPSQILKGSSEEVALAQSVFQKRVPHISDTREHDRASQKNLKTVEVESIKRGG